MRVTRPWQEPLGPAPNDPVESVLVSVGDYSWYSLPLKLATCFRFTVNMLRTCLKKLILERASSGPTVRAKLLCVYLYVYIN